MRKFYLTYLFLLLKINVIACEENIDSNKDPINSTSEEQYDETKENTKEDKNEKQDSDPPPFEDLYCGQKNCYELLGVTR